MSDNEPHFEQERSLEEAIARLGEYAREIGFMTTPEIDNLAASINAETEAAVIPQWHELAEKQIELAAPGIDHMKAQAALMVEEIRLNLKAGNTVYARRSLNDAIEFIDFNRWLDNEAIMEDIADYLNDLGYMLQSMEK